MKNFLYFLLGNLVDFPEELKIEEKNLGEGSWQYQISANQKDLGKIIGREGKVIQAIRNLAKIRAIKEGKRIQLTVG